MRATLKSAVVFLFLTCTYSRAQQTTKSIVSTTAASVDYSHLPLSFEVNQGQTDPEVLFLAHGKGYALYLDGSEAVLRLRRGTAPRTEANGVRQTVRTEATESTIHMTLMDARLGAFTGQEPLPGTVNYFIGNDPARWHSAIPTYRRVKYAAVYRGVDLVYHGEGQQLEYDFIVAPGADSAAIRLRLSGTERIAIDRAGNLKIGTKAGTITFQKPLLYQRIGKRKITVPGGFMLAGDHSVGFRIGRYDRHLPLVIDPTLAYSGYLGGSTGATGNGIAVDASGSAYVTGQTEDLDFPGTTGYYQPKSNEAADVSNAFIAKFNPAGTALVYATYLGGSGDTDGGGSGGAGIAVDGSGNAYVCGGTGSQSFPTVSPFQSRNPSSNGSVPFVAKLNPTGTGLIYSTYLGGSGNGNGDGDTAIRIAVNAAGNAYVTGDTFSQDFPTLNPIQPANRAYGNSGSNAFISELNRAGNGLVFSTYLGGSGIASPNGDDTDNGDAASGIALDGTDNVYVAGFTNSIDFPFTSDAYQKANKAQSNQTSNAFVAALNSAGSKLIYATYLGGSGVVSANSGGVFGDEAFAIAVDSAGDAYVTGFAFSSDFPLSSTPYQNSNRAAMKSLQNAFVSKFNPTGSKLLYSTYLGGAGGTFDGIVPFGDYTYGIAADTSGNAYVVGLATSQNFPTTTGSYQPQNNAAGNASNAFITEINPAGTALVYSTYLGGTGLAYTTYPGGPTIYSGDYAVAVALDPSANLYTTGQACSRNFPVAGMPFQKASNTTSTDGCNAFVSKISFNSTSTLTPTTTSLLSDGNPQNTGVKVTFTASVQPNSGAGIVTGNVIFSNDGTQAASVALDATAHAAYQTATLPAGTHAVTASYSGNATFAASSGELTETILGPPAAITIVDGSNQTTTYGQAFAVPLIVNVQDVNGHALSGVTVVFSGSELSFSPTSAVTDIYGDATVSATANASGSITAVANVSGISKSAIFLLTALKPILTITANSVSISYGQAIPALTYTITGFVNSDTSSVLSGLPAESTTAKLGSTAGTYPIVISKGTLTAANYNFTFVNGVLTVVRPVPAPVISTNGGTYNSVQSVTITDSVPGALLLYTTDGSTPTTSSSKYAGPISVSTSETISVIATATGYQQSSLVTATYTLQVATPAFRPNSGTYSTKQAVSIMDLTPSSNIFYTLDGSTPTSASARYTAPINVTASETIKAIALATGFQSSPIVLASYLLQAAAPTFSPGAGTYISKVTVEISDTSPGATIHFTTDGSLPSASSSEYSGPITITTTENIRAIAILPEIPQSPITSGTFTIVAPPILTPYGSEFPDEYYAPLIQVNEQRMNGCHTGLPPTYYLTQYYTSVMVDIASQQTYINGNVRENFFPLNRVSPGVWIPYTATYTDSPSFGGDGFVFSGAFGANPTSTYKLSLSSAGLLTISEAGSGIDDQTYFPVFTSVLNGNASWSGTEIIDLNTGTDKWRFSASFTGSYPFNNRTCSLSATLNASASNSFTVLMNGVINPPIVTNPASVFTVVDPNPDLLSGTAIVTAATAEDAAPEDPGRYLANLERGRPVVGLATDGVAQVLIRINASSVGERFTLSMANACVGLDQSACTNQSGLLFDPLNPPDDLYGTASGATQTVAAVNTDNAGPMAFAAYRAPVDFVRSDADLNSASHTLNITVQSDKTGPQPNVTLVLVRPPVFTIHGIFSTPEVFDDLLSAINNPASPLFSTFGLDYSDNIDSDVSSTSPAALRLSSQPILRNVIGVSYNAPFLLDDMVASIEEFKDNGPFPDQTSMPVAAVQGDIIAHSLGGLMARGMAHVGADYPLAPDTQASFYDDESYGRGYIHKLITLGTPHLGSNFAQRLINGDQNPNDPRVGVLFPNIGGNDCTRSQAALFGDYNFNSVIINGTTYPGASFDLYGDPTNGITSPTISLLNNSGLLPIRAALIAAEYNSSNDSKALAFAGAVARARCGTQTVFATKTGASWKAGIVPCGNLKCSVHYGDFLADNYGYDSWKNIFNGGASDALVPFTSATFGQPAFSLFQGVVHGPGTVGAAGLVGKVPFIDPHVGFNGPQLLSPSSSLDPNESIPLKVMQLLNTSTNDTAVFIDLP